jgi:monoamine oxidase
MAQPLEDRIFLQAPVRRVEHGSDGIAVVTDRGTIRGQALIAALAPALCARIDWQPALPPARDRLQSRYAMGHGIKFVALYERQWWHDAGLLGLGVSQEPLWVAVDATGPDDDGARLVGFSAVTGPDMGRWGDLFADEAAAKRMFVEQVAHYFGPGPEPSELHLFDWSGDAWSLGCAAGLGPGTLSTVGPTLRAPIGPMVWAGAETGTPQNDWMEAAVSAGQRAAEEALARIGAAQG